MRLTQGPFPPAKEWDAYDPWEEEPMRPVEWLVLVPVAVACFIAFWVGLGFAIVVLS